MRSWKSCKLLDFHGEFACQATFHVLDRPRAKRVSGSIDDTFTILEMILDISIFCCILAKLKSGQ